jgi:3-hydroxymyristoyl/3-hydroxydecanoyl-(acyl carrier protein) dehydratase
MVSMSTAGSLGRRSVYFRVTSPIVDGLTILEEAVAAGGWRARLRFEASSPVFAGHFEGDPVLPGIAHLVILAHALRVLRGPRASVAEVRWLRLRCLVRPEEVLEVAVDGPDADGACRFEARVGRARAAGGVARCRVG